MDSDIKIVITLLITIVLFGFGWLIFDAGQRSIFESCEKASFFYYKDKVFECLPYKKGTIDREIPVTPPH